MRLCSRGAIRTPEQAFGGKILSALVARLDLVTGMDYAERRAT
jgi:hypothetical protein